MDKGNGSREGTPPWVYRWRRACGPPRVAWFLVGSWCVPLCCSFLLLQELPKQWVIELVSSAA